MDGIQIEEYKYVLWSMGLLETPEVMLVPPRFVNLKAAKFEYYFSGELR